MKVTKSCVLIVILLIITIGCSPQKNPRDESDFLKIGSLHQVKTDNPLFDYSLGLFSIITNPPLLQANPQGVPEGLLAENFTVSPDFTTWTFRIAKNYYWSDGVPVSPQDVKFTLEYKGVHVPSRRWLKNSLLSATVIPPDGVQLTFNKPYSRLDIELASLRIFPRHIWEKVKNPQYEPPAGKHTGCGPFIIDKVDLNAGVVSYRQNPYWQGKKPGFPGIECHLYQNLDVLALALEKGYIDTFYQYAGSFPYANIPRLRASGRFNLLENPGKGVTFLGFNLQKEPFSFPWFRRAVSYAIDYEEILKLIVSGYGEVPRQGFVPGDLLYFKESPLLRRDVNKARQILSEAGFTPANLAYRGGLVLLSTPPNLRLCELVKDYLHDIDIAVNIKIVDPAAWFSMKEQYNYDLTITNTSPWGLRMHANWGTGYFDCRRSGEGVLHTVSDPVFLDLCDHILASRDPVKLKTFAWQLQDYYAEKLPALALLWKTNISPVNKSLSPWHTDPLYGFFNITNFIRLRRGHESD